jgi:hypothetical protein
MAMAAAIVMVMPTAALMATLMTMAAAEKEYQLKMSS